MDIRENYYLSITGLLSHKLRSFLTMLGIIFGVAAVLAMLSIGAGARQETLAQIKLMGLNNVFVYSDQIVAEEENDGAVIEGRGLTISDAEMLREMNPLLTAAIPQKQWEDIRVIYGSERARCSVIGTTPEFLEAHNLALDSGGWFSYRDCQEVRRVCVLGNSIKHDLFFYEEAVGKQIKIVDIWFTIIGVAGEIPGSTGGISGTDQDMNHNVYIPLSSARMRLPSDGEKPEVEAIILQVTSSDRIHEAANLARSQLLVRHRDKADFRIVIPEVLLKQSQRTQRVFNIVMGAIAGISLLVGGIGIMNIMLATILERTREIGIRRAVGATRRDILGQFLIEAVLLSFSGGILGVILGYLMTIGIAHYAHWNTIIEAMAVILSFGVSTAVGIVFGIYPARKAAMLNPIDSLRHE